MLLAIDTSTSSTYVAVYTADNRLFERSCTSDEVGTFSHNEELANLIASTLDDAAIRPTDLKSLIIGQGPGSFTGLRIGSAFMKGLSFGLRIPLYQLSSLEAMAFSASRPDCLIVPVADARRGEYFTAVFNGTRDGGVERLQAESILDAQVLEERLATYADKSKAILFLDASDGAAEELKEKLADRFAGGVFVSKPARSIASGLIGAYGRGVHDEDYSVGRLARLSPHYIREVAALTIEQRKARKTVHQ